MHVEGSIVIDRPVDEVFDFVADERNEPRYNAGMIRVEKLSPGPIGLGTCFEAEMISGGRRAPMTIEFTTFDRPRRLASSTRLSTMDIHGTLLFEPVPEGTRMTWRWELRPRGLLRVAGPLVRRMGQRQEQEIWAGLKRCLEAGERASTVAATSARTVGSA
jgi:Polyketide cyclase / dehydrase and lipid transport